MGNCVAGTPVELINTMGPGQSGPRCFLKFDNNGSDHDEMDPYRRALHTTFQLRDLARGLVLHLAARFRRRFLRADVWVLSLADEIDFARWRRRVNEPNTPEVEAWIGSGELDLDESEFRTVTLH